MILKSGEERVTLPEYVERTMVQLAIYPNGNPEHHLDSYGMMVCQVEPSTIVELWAKTRGKDGVMLRALPSCFAIGNGDVLMMSPVPDKDYYAEFRYCPAMKVI